MIKTSHSHPILIDSVQPLGVKGIIGMTFCPGKKQKGALSGGEWDRDLGIDVDKIAAWGCTVLVSLIEDHEIEELQITHVAEVLNGKIAYYRLPIIDGSIPDSLWETAWHTIGTDLRQRLVDGEKLVIHYKGGLGRTGIIAARLLVEFGEDPESAILRVRAARPGAIENALQESFVRSILSIANSNQPPKTTDLTD